MGTKAARRVAAAVAMAAAMTLLVAGCDESGLTSGSLGSTETAAAGNAAGDGSALATLATLTVRAEDTSTEYERDEFGPSWKDVDKNGCDTRNDILHRDLRSVTVRTDDDCIVLTGELTDPYTNRIIRFDRARNASGVQIDHVVALADAWRTGAYAWTDDQRLAFANDPQNLLAVDGPTNTKKSDQDAAEWLPPAAGYRCQYVARQIGLKSRYGLWVTQAEADAMQAVLNSCPTQAVLGA